MPKIITPADIASWFVKYNPTVALLKPYKNHATPLSCRCLVCGHTWHPYLRSIQNCAKGEGNGCSECAKLLVSKARALTTADVDARLKKVHGSKVKRIGPYLGMDKPMKCRCTTCKSVWSPLPSNVTRSNGCPYCNNLEHFTYTPYKLGRRTVFVQGVENHALDWIVKNTSIKPSHILLHKEHKKWVDYTLNGVKRKHQPDLFIPTRNLFVEVKSLGSSGLGRYDCFGISAKTLFRELKAKAKGAMAEGYTYKLIVINGESKVHVPKNWFNLNRTQVLEKICLS